MKVKWKQHEYVLNYLSWHVLFGKNPPKTLISKWCGLFKTTRAQLLLCNFCPLMRSQPRQCLCWCSLWYVTNNYRLMGQLTLLSLKRLNLKHFKCYYFLEQQQQCVMLIYFSRLCKTVHPFIWHAFYFIWFKWIHHPSSTATSGVHGSSSLSKEFRISLSLDCSSYSSVGIPRHSQANLEM